MALVRRRDSVGWYSPPLLVLGALAAGPLHGYGIIQQVRQATGITLGAGTLYAALARLEGDGMVRALAATDRRRPYEITADGARELRTKVSQMSAFAANTTARLARGTA
jgi:DNA-binding PadR family transcriptional regulator